MTDLIIKSGRFHPKDCGKILENVKQQKYHRGKESNKEGVWALMKLVAVETNNWLL